MKEILPTKGKVTQVDDDLFDRFNQWEWYCDNNGYAVRTDKSSGKKKMIWMHREIAATPEGMDTDHINGDRLYNLRSNLRVCTRSENMQNRGKIVNSASGYKGVTWNRDRQKWQAQIMVNYENVYLGRFIDPAEAAKVYDAGALKYHGNFAVLNFPK